jgi:protein-arginine kinase activator protein McsA
MDKLKQKLKKLRTEKEKHLELENYETAAQIRDKEREIMKKINTFSGK